MQLSTTVTSAKLPTPRLINEACWGEVPILHVTKAWWEDALQELILRLQYTIGVYSQNLYHVHRRHVASCWMSSGISVLRGESNPKHQQDGTFQAVR